MPKLINRLLLVSLFFVDPLVAGENPEYRSLAEYYAPVVYQETRSATLDFITRFDFDGDWNGANNWDNAYLFELPAYVYYAVIESSGHYFITYAFFHPRDYTARPMEGFAPKTEHENDMEGCTLVIEKDETAWGRPILLETLAHDHFYKYDNPHYPQVEEGSASLDGSIVFLKQENATRHRQPALYIEPEGHGVKAATKQVLDSSFQHPGVIYRFAGRGAEVPPGKTATDVSYDLISIEETLWAKRLEVGKNSLYCCSDLYSLPGGQMTPLGSSFNGPIGSCAAKPPWGWDQADDGPIEKGDWFRDPLFAYSQQLTISGFAGTYVYDPYLQVEVGAGRPAGTPCSESGKSKTLKEAITSSLLGIGKVLLESGLSSKEVGERAKQLFLTDTVLLEWAQREELERWSWDETLTAPNLPSLMTVNLVDQIRIPLRPESAISSPLLSVPTRYFDRLIMKYRISVPGAKAKVSWRYEGVTDFDQDHSLTFDLEESAGWSIGHLDLAQSPQWDDSKNMAQIRMEILSLQDKKISSFDPSDPGSQNQSVPGLFAVSYIVFDRNAFSDTFER